MSHTVHYPSSAFGEINRALADTKDVPFNNGQFESINYIRNCYDSGLVHVTINEKRAERLVLVSVTDANGGDLEPYIRDRIIELFNIDFEHY